MKVVRQYNSLSPKDRGAVVALGNFDGVHLGHQAVLAAAKREALGLGVPFAVLVFEPHPREFFRPEGEDFRLTPMPVKARVLASLGADIVYALPFDTEMAAKLAQEFVIDVLVNGLQIVHAVVGEDFRFGRGRSGDAAVLGYMGEMEGFGTSFVKPIIGAEGEISSTHIRDLLRHGKPEEAAKMLGRSWAIQGRVRPGDQRGRTIGFPTANLTLDGYLKPAFGIYAIKVEVLSGSYAGMHYDGVGYVGKRPTFGKTDIILEANLFDFKGDLYDAEISVDMRAFIRYDQKFDGVDALMAQMAKDAERARALLASD
ncbi:MAG TPA: bifunctional riboflavin kinase/FAD synthetase [Alphaproteobacteria bacterium]|nr:bifunctional riboflavin kinase/FAD synthetase [Alphaproteobacteria bacterium]